MKNDLTDAARNNIDAAIRDLISADRKGDSPSGNINLRDAIHCLRSAITECHFAGHGRSTVKLTGVLADMGEIGTFRNSRRDWLLESVATNLHRIAHLDCGTHAPHGWYTDARKTA